MTFNPQKISLAKGVRIYACNTHSTGLLNPTVAEIALRPTTVAVEELVECYITCLAILFHCKKTILQAEKDGQLEPV